MRSLPLLDELEAALTSGSIPRRVDILSRVTDLFVNNAENYSEEQIGVFDDVMARLVSAIETKARAKLAQRLAPIANAPSNVIHMLAFDDDIEVARPVLSLSERLDERDLLISAGTKSQKHLFAISRRRIAERGGDQRSGRTRRPRSRPFGGEEHRRAFFRRRLPHAGQSLRRRRCTGDRSRPAQRYSAARISWCCSKRHRARCARGLSAENPQASTDDRRRRRRSRRRHPRGGPQCVAGFRRRAGGRRAAKPHPPHRRSRSLSICARPQVRGDRDRAVDHVRHADRRGRARAARSRRRDHPHSRQSRWPVVDDDQGHPAVARRRPRHVGKGSRPGTDELQPVATRHRPPRARLLPRPCQKADAAGPGGRCQWLRLILRN